MSSSKSENLQTVKDDIKALVVSSKSRMSVSDLCNDYLKNIGKRLTGLEFGYKNVQEFLQRECTDILKIETFGGETTLCPILKTEAGKNLNSLILKQKSTKPHTRVRKTIVANQANTQNGPAKKNISKIDTPTDRSCKPTLSVIKNDKSKSTWAPTVPPKSDGKDKTVDKVMKNLQFLIKKHKKMRGSELSPFYKLQFKEPLDIEKLGFATVLSLIESSPEVFTVQKLHASDDWIVYDQSVKHEKEFWAKYQENREQKENRKTSLDSLIFGMKALPYTDTDPELTPENCIPFDHIINLVKPPSVDTEVLIYVTEVLDPSHFWYHIRSPAHNEALHSLMTKIDTFYKSNINIYKMTRAQMKPGHYCAVKFCNVYHRAVVLRNISESLIKVRYVDYGTIEEVSTDDVRLLLKEFGQLEEQALPARLSGMRPVNRIWSFAARAKFLQLTSSKLLSAHVCSMDQEDVSTLVLIDKSQEIYYDIAFVLYEEGLAKPVSNNEKHRKLSDTIHLFPSFKDLNTGVFPMFVDFENNTEKSLIFESFLSSFCDMFDDDIPAEQTTSVSTNLNRIAFIRDMNDIAINPYTAPNFHPPSYQSGFNDFEYASNYPIYEPRSYDRPWPYPPRSYDQPWPYSPRSYDPYRKFNTRYPMEAQYNPPGPSYGNPNLMPNMWPYYAPNRLMQFYRDEFEKNSNYGTSMSKLYDPQNDPDIEFGRFDEMFQIPTPRMLINDSLKSRNKKTIMNIKKEKCSQDDTFETEFDSNAKNVLTLIDILRIAGQDIDIWKVKYKGDYLDSSFISLEQIFYHFIKPEGYQKFWDNFNSGNIQLELFQLHFYQPSVLRRLKTQGRSDAIINECFKIHFISQKYIYKTEENVILLKLDHVAHFLKYHNKNLKVRYQDIMKDMLPNLEKYVKPKML